MIYSATYHLYMWNRSNIECRAKNTNGRSFFFVMKFNREVGDNPQIMQICLWLIDGLTLLVNVFKLLIFQSSVFCRYFFFKWNFKSIAIAPALGSLNHDSFAAYDLIGQIIRHYIRVWIYPQKCCLIYGYNYSFKYPLCMLYMCTINLVEEQKRGNVLFLFFFILLMVFQIW